MKLTFAEVVDVIESTLRSEGYHLTDIRAISVEGGVVVGHTISFDHTIHHSLSETSVVKTGSKMPGDVL